MRDLYNKQLLDLGNEIVQMGHLCSDALEGAIKSLHEKDIDLANKIQKSDNLIDAKEREIEQMCLNIFLHQQPIASDLRMVSAALKMITDLERIGDQASDIAEIVACIDFKEQAHFAIIEEMATIAQKMLKESVEAFANSDVALAKSVIEADDMVDDLLEKVRLLMVDLIVEHNHNAVTIIDLCMIAKYLERIGDHAVNVANWAVFRVLGEDPDKHAAQSVAGTLAVQSYHLSRLFLSPWRHSFQPLKKIVKINQKFNRGACISGPFYLQSTRSSSHFTLERIGDQSSNITEIVTCIDFKERAHFAIIEDMATKAQKMLKE